MLRRDVLLACSMVCLSIIDKSPVYTSSSSAVAMANHSAISSSRAMGDLRAGTSKPHWRDRPLCGGGRRGPTPHLDRLHRPAHRHVRDPSRPEHPTKGPAEPDRALVALAVGARL